MASGLQKFVNQVKSTALGVADTFTPVLKDSKFRDSGMITPEEFVQAGDYLVYHCPTWSWSSGDSSRKKSYLPTDKQFLVTKNVPCYRRCHQMAVLPENERIVRLDASDEEGWIDTHHGVVLEQVTEKVVEMTLEGDKKTAPVVSMETPLVGVVGDVGDSDSDDSGPAVDIDEYPLEEDDPATLQPPPPTSKADEDTILQTRTYDLNISYDNYYRTPRLWLFGYNESQKPLSETQMYEDVSQDHLNKTVTLEQHPHLPPPPRLSVHPCRHAEVMKKIMTMIEEDGRQLEVHSYLLVFLKFVQAVIPTIEYDYTQQLAITSA